jgi:NTP pyrophosphatase (non-canonical NTP hydrolase)
LSNLDLETSLINTINNYSNYIYNWAQEKGFWEDKDNSCFASEKHALMHTEISESLEALRHGDPPDDKIPKFSCCEAELADAVIRIMDYCKAYDLRLGEAIVAKMEYNETRPYKHGKKF